MLVGAAYEDSSLFRRETQGETLRLLPGVCGCGVGSAVNHFGMSQARLIVRSPHGGKQPGRGRESTEPGLTPILKLFSLWISGHLSQGDVGFLLLAAKCSLTEAVVVPHTNYQRQQ